VTESRWFVHCGRRYEWSGGFGAIFKSYEHNVKQGDVRVIGEDMFYAYLIYPRWFRSSEVCWTLPKPTIDDINRIRERMFM
jgi:hypothetical protein